ncbi:MAG: hypothetical protein ACPG5B_07740 [Chitinophagales bacterium]
MKKTTYFFFTILFIFLLSSCSKEDFSKDIVNLVTYNEASETEAAKLLPISCNFTETLPFIGSTLWDNGTYNCADKLKHYFNCLNNTVQANCPLETQNVNFLIENSYNGNTDYIFQHISSDGWYNISPEGQIAIKDAIEEMANDYKNSQPELAEYALTSLVSVSCNVLICCTDQPSVSVTVRYKKVCKNVVDVGDFGGI